LARFLFKCCALTSPLEGQFLTPYSLAIENQS
jgi:hypothetical protein